MRKDCLLLSTGNKSESIMTNSQIIGSPVGTGNWGKRRGKMAMGSGWPKLKW